MKSKFLLLASCLFDIAMLFAYSIMDDQYKKAGVDIDAGNQFVEIIKPFIKNTRRRGVLTSIGGFGGLFALDTIKYKEPVLVASTDGVGTKLKLAIELNRFDTIGTDLVAMCVNDIACCGAEPLFFLDYFATGRLKPEEHSKIVEGIAEACKKINCAIIGGETAEMPDLYARDDFDLAGFAVGVVEKNKIIDGSDIRIDDDIIGISSSGFHSNGYSLIRKIILEKNLELAKPVAGLEGNLGDMLLTPTKLYSPLVSSLLRTHKIAGISHITGGAFVDKIARIIPPSVKAVINKKSWLIPPLMKYFQQVGEIEDSEMYRVFNCGIGLVIIADSKQTEEICQIARAFKDEAYVIGQIRPREKDEPKIVIE